MTVIAWRRPYMVSDGRISDEGDNSIFTNKAKKIHELSNGDLVGIAGDAEHRPLVELLNKTKGKIPTSKQIVSLQLDFEAILAKRDGTVWYLSGGKKDKNEEWFGQALECQDAFVAIGTGSKYAYGAMDRGATAKQAVLTAIRYDTACGGTPQVFELSKE